MTQHVSWFKVMIIGANDHDDITLSEIPVHDNPDMLYSGMHNPGEHLSFHSAETRQVEGLPDDKNCVILTVITNDARTVYALLRMVENGELDMVVSWCKPPKEE